MVAAGVSAEDLRFEVVGGWEQLPAGLVHQDCCGVAVDSDDNVYVLTRNESRVIVYSKDGAFLRSWGEDLFSNRGHGLTIGPDDSIYCVDDGAHCIYKFTRRGELVLTVGTRGVAAETGYDGTLESVRGGPPFNRPTNVAIGPEGDLYVADGYGNCKIHRFTASGELVRSWGAPGSGAGEFRTPHGIAVDGTGTVIVADRENDRLQFFSREGVYSHEWNDVQRPSNVALDGDGRIYVSEMSWRVGDVSPLHGTSTHENPGRVSVFEPAGRVIARWGGPDRNAPGNFSAAHDIAVDSQGDVYVAEVTQTFAVAVGLAPPGSKSFQKFTAAGARR